VPRFKKIIGVAVFGATAIAGAVVAASPVSAAPVGIDVTISETIPLTTGTLTDGSIPACTSPTVTTFDATATTYGSLQVFRGVKEFDCGGGDTFTLRYAAATSGCAAYDFGFWRVTGGSGEFDGLRGRGVLIGSYTLDGEPGDACNNNGIDDRYIGVLRF